MVFLDFSNLQLKALLVPIRTPELDIIRGILHVVSGGEVVHLRGRPVGALTHEGPFGTA